MCLRLSCCRNQEQLTNHFYKKKNLELFWFFMNNLSLNYKFVFIWCLFSIYMFILNMIKYTRFPLELLFPYTFYSWNYTFFTNTKNLENSVPNSFLKWLFLLIYIFYISNIIMNLPFMYVFKTFFTLNYLAISLHETGQEQRIGKSKLSLQRHT